MTNFVFCIHNHQPAGNFESVLEEAYKTSYLPFLELISKYPHVKLTLHTTGFLLDWMAEKHPEYIDILRGMVSTGQAEIMGGAYYEPVISVIPEDDRVGQITLMSDRIEELFGTRPKGIWLAERVWEPGLPTTLRKAGIEYLVVDDYHFIKAGLRKDELGGYYITEDQGNVVKILPGNEALRYLIPFKPVDKLEEYLKGLKAHFKKGASAIYGDDGEKFGVWPGTYKWVFDEGWLEGFFQFIENSRDWLKPLNIGEFLEQEEPLGQIYLPTTSYMEMGEWALPAEASKEYTDLVEEVKDWRDGERIRRFLQGGTWRNFFSKYPEANWLHKRMLLVSKEIRERKAKGQGGEVLKKAERLLYRGQCNDAYWHGVFGGLYLPHLRTEVFKNLLCAENMVNGASSHSVQVLDVDADSHAEVLMRARDINLFLSPRNGGTLFEFDYMPKTVNLSNTLSRWYEGYHHKLAYSTPENSDVSGKSIHEFVKVKEPGLDKYLKYDKTRRASFTDHFIGDETGWESFFSNNYKELGDFVNNRYELEKRGERAILSRDGKVLGSLVSITKEFRLDGNNAFVVEYTIENTGLASVDGLRFGVELNLLLPCCDGPACLYQSTPPFADPMDIGLGSSGEAQRIEKLNLADTLTGVIASIEPDRPATLWRSPVHTVSLSEGGFEKIYQGTCLVFLFPVVFRDGEMKLSFRVKAEGIA